MFFSKTDCALYLPDKNPFAIGENATEENITRAAESLHISQPYLSKQLMELENEFGKQLLIRGKRKITLTADGIILRKRA